VAQGSKDNVANTARWQGRQLRHHLESPRKTRPVSSRVAMAATPASAATPNLRGMLLLIARGSGVPTLILRQARSIGGWCRIACRFICAWQLSQASADR
jgi:hypothetical protein